MSKKTIFIIGSGAREHTIAWKLSQSKRVGKIYIAPGNGGTRLVGENVPIETTNIKKLIDFAKAQKVDLTIIGPEGPLSLGIVDQFEKAGLRIFGPELSSARLESSKSWAMDFMTRHNLPCPKSKTFDHVEDAKGYVAKIKGNCVIKADGLCQGKGVYVCSNVTEGNDALNQLMVKKVFGKEGAKIIIQEKLVGKEVSMMAFCDGTHAIPLVSAQDYKRIFDRDMGPNTGGMGAVAPATRVPKSCFKKIHGLLRRSVSGMKEEGNSYHGILYAGIMMVGSKPYLLEFNCRFGDPETEVQLPLLKSDLLPILEACVDGSLTQNLVHWKNGASVCVVVAASGYPGSYTKGEVIHEKSTTPAILMFHAGTSYDKSTLQTNGGRVLTVGAVASTVSQARKKIYAQIGKTIRFNGMQFRKDIGV